MRCVLITGAILPALLATLARAQPAPTTAASGGSAKREIVSKFQSWVATIPPDPADNELRAKLKERHNSAARLLGLRISEFQKGTRDISTVFDSARLVAESQLDLARNQQERESFIQQMISEAKAVEDLVQKQVSDGFVPEADLERARFARLSAEVMLLTARRPATTQASDRHD
jgi:hypothetical protein